MAAVKLLVIEAIRKTVSLVGAGPAGSASAPIPREWTTAPPTRRA